MEKKEKKENKYQYLIVFQGWYDGGWTDIMARDARCTTEEWLAWREDIHAYYSEDPRPYRSIRRRMLAKEKFHA